MNILIINCATTIMEGTLFDESFDIRTRTSAEYQPQYLRDGRTEQNPLEWLNALIEICRDVTEYLNPSGEKLDAIGYTAQRSSVVAMGDDGKPLRNAITWQDRRNRELVKRLEPKMDEIFAHTGARVNTVFSGTKMAYIRENEPDIYARTVKFLTAGDFLGYCMTGEYRTDATYGSRSLLMNIQSSEWDGAMLDLIGVDVEKLPEIAQPGSIIGFTTDAFSRMSGVPAGIPVITCGGDQQCAALGMGLVETGTAEITAGPGGYIFQNSNIVPEGAERGILCSASAIPGQYVLEASMLSTDGLFRWCNTLLYGKDGVRPGSFSEIDAAVRETPAGSNGCIALPYFQGRGTPDWNAGAYGAFLHVSLGTSKGDFARSILESIAYEMANMMECYDGLAELPHDLNLSGYLTSSEVFCQILADVTGRKLRKNISSVNMTAFGAYISAAVTLGLFSDHTEAYFRGKRRLRFHKYTPDGSVRDVYDAGRSEMNRAYAHLMAEH